MDKATWRSSLAVHEEVTQRLLVVQTSSRLGEERPQTDDLHGERFRNRARHTISHNNALDRRGAQALVGRTDQETMAGDHGEVLRHTADRQHGLDGRLDCPSCTHHIVYHERNTTTRVAHDPPQTDELKGQKCSLGARVVGYHEA